MKVFHLSTECFPVAKVGGLADVVGALPKFQQKLEVNASVIMPWYDKDFVREQELKIVAEDHFSQGSEELNYIIYNVKKDVLGFPLYLIKIPGKLDRPNVYSYEDEDEQWIAFQHAFLHWLKYHQETNPDILHCHDHHVGLLPFLAKHSDEFNTFSSIKTVFTVHNGQYQGWLDWDKAPLLPAFDTWKWGLMDWDGQINPLATAIKCADAYTTVSEGYLDELLTNANGLENLFQDQRHKGYGIVNGIDTSYWNPNTDPEVQPNYKVRTVNKRKRANKEAFCDRYDIPADLPLISFIGRCAYEKGADLLNPIFSKLYAHHPDGFSTFILGSGDPHIEDSIRQLQADHPSCVATHIGYDESLAHQVYASTDMLIMPSRVEPCGLNQLYSLKYGTIPIVRDIGGLHDTVIDRQDKNGYGFVFESEDPDSAVAAVERAFETHQSNRKWGVIRARAMRLDFSWDKSAQKYIELYQKL